MVNNEMKVMGFILYSLGCVFYTLAISLSSMAWITYRKIKKIDAKIDSLQTRGYTLSGNDVHTGQLQGFVIAKEILENP